jgi:hypothetical protein
MVELLLFEEMAVLPWERHRPVLGRKSVAADGTIKVMALTVFIALR